MQNIAAACCQATKTAASAQNEGAPTLTHAGTKKTRHSPRDIRLMRCLLDADGQPVDRMELMRLVGAINIPDKVMHAKRRYSVTITTSFKQQPDRDGGIVKVGQYSIVGDAAQAKAREVLALLTSEA
jgi:hypothetical protein